MPPSILSAHRVQIIPGDVLVLTVADFGFTEEDIQMCVETFAEDADVSVLVFKESYYRDLKKLSLMELVTLQSRIEDAIRDLSVRDSRAEA